MNEDSRWIYQPSLGSPIGSEHQWGDIAPDKQGIIFDPDVWHFAGWNALYVDWHVKWRL